MKEIAERREASAAGAATGFDAKRAAARGLARHSLALQWALLLSITAAVATLLSIAGLPAALFLGAMASGVAAGVNGASVRVPRLPYLGAQGIIGCLIAGAITPDIVHAVGREWPVFLGTTLAIIAASGVLGFMLSRWRVFPGTTSIWGAWPGGASAMVIMAAEFGADARLVAFMQYFRVMCVASLASVVAAFTVGSAGARPEVHWFVVTDGRALVDSLALAGAGAALGRLSRLPSGPMLLTLILGAALHGAGIIAIELPRPLLAATYVVLGWTVGLNFTPGILWHALRALPKILASVTLLIAFCAGLAFLLTQVLGVSPLTAYLATSPGGMDSVAIIAASSHVDMPFVMALQTFRFLLIVLAGPPIARFIARQIDPATEAEALHDLNAESAARNAVNQAKGTATDRPLCS